ncbi:MAG: A24 family peptidase [Gammaproteobacteria bacterium]
MSVLITLQQNPTAFCLFLGILGLIVGSFLNVVIYRLPRMMENDWRAQCCELLELDASDEKTEPPFNLVKPRSQCPHCGHQINALENIPVLSYLFLKGKCATCHKRISIRYPVIEITSGVAAAVVACHFGYGLQTASAVLLTWALICLSMIDFDHQLLPDDITLPFLWLGLACNLFGVFTDIYSSLIGAMVGYGVLWCVYILFKLVTGKEGMGYGDFKLLAMLGAWLGWQMLPVIILVSSFLGAIIGIGMILFRSHDKSTPIPFGPYLAIAGWIALMWGPAITSAYIKWAFSA